MNTPSTPPEGAWSGRFSEPVSEIVKRYTASIPFDYRLAEFDIQGSLAHAAMLHHVGVLSKDDLDAIRRGMAELLEDIRADRFE
jgi:argininosuccinate lyase